METRFLATALSLLCVPALLAGCAGAAPAAAVPEATRHERVPEQIISATASGSARELYERGNRALLTGRFEDAKNALETLLAAWGVGSTDDRELLEPLARYDLALTYEGLARRSSARDAYLEVERRFPTHPIAKLARARLYSVHVYLEEWAALQQVAERALAQLDSPGVASGAPAHSSIDPPQRLAALGARAIARIELGDEGGASRDVQDGRDIIDTLRIGDGGRLPAAAAMIRFADGEVRRTRSEKVSFAPPSGARTTTREDLAAFMPKMELRCQGLMAAQSAYADAMRAQDPFFIAFGAFRVGEMYKALHRDLMAIPPTTQAKTESQQQLFLAMMHVRYRVLLEKAHDMMVRTLGMAPVDAPAQRDPDYSVWLKRAALAKTEIERAIEEERAFIKTLPYDERTVQRALEIMREKAEKSAPAKSP